MLKIIEKLTIQQTKIEIQTDEKEIQQTKIEIQTDEKEIQQTN